MLKDPKICFCDDTLPGCLDIKEGDMICYLPYSMGRMKFLWGDRGRRGLPAGKIWLDENGAFQAENPFKFTAFQVKNNTDGHSIKCRNFCSFLFFHSHRQAQGFASERILLTYR